MLKVILTPAVRRRLQTRLKHPGNLNPKLLPRLQCILWRADSERPTDIAKLLEVDRTTVTIWTNIFLSQGVKGLLSQHYQGNHRYLTAKQEAELAKKVEDSLFGRLKDIEAWVESRFKVHYSPKGLGKLMNRLKLVKKTPGIVPDKADPAKQRTFLK